MPHINPHIRFNGNAEEAFNFYQSVFGGEFSKLLRYKDIASEQYPIPENDANRLMYIALPLGIGSVLMGSDTMEMMGRVTENDNRNSIAVSAESREGADKLFSGLADGGNIEMPMSDGPFGAYFGMLTDKYGIEWMVQFESS